MTNKVENPDFAYHSPLLELVPDAAPAVSDNGLPPFMGVAWHYGNPLTEQRNFATGALVDRSHRTVLHVTGTDAPTFLHNLLSQKLDDVPDGFSASALNLDGQGRILHQADMTKTGAEFYIDLPAADAATLLDYFQKMVFWSKVEFDQPDVGMLSVIGTDVTAPPATIVARQLPFGPYQRQDFVIPRAQLIDAATDLINQGAAPTGLMAYTAERVRAGIPEKDLDLDEKSIPHEVPGLINRGERIAAVHLEKGCYRGQETVARVENLGRAPRLLVMLHLDGSTPILPTPGTPITNKGRTVGRVGTVVHDHEYGPIALALVKRTALSSQSLLAGESAVLVDQDSIPAEEQSQAGRAAINRLKGLD